MYREWTPPCFNFNETSFASMETETSSTMPQTFMTEKEHQKDLNKSILLAQIPVYLARRRADVGAIRNALALDDFACIQSVGHNLKGTGSSYGFPRITEIGGLLESAARTGSRGVIGTLLEDLNTYLQSVDPQIATANDLPGAPPQPETPESDAGGSVCAHENKDVVSH